LVNGEAVGVDVPIGFVKEGRIVLNIHPQAVNRFEFIDEWLQFSARFVGRSHMVQIPVASVLAIYARENGQGISFQESSGDKQTGSTPRPPRKRPALKLVK
jgi:stringent starvation protein B